MKIHDVKSKSLTCILNYILLLLMNMWLSTLQTTDSRASEPHRLCSLTKVVKLLIRREKEKKKIEKSTHFHFHNLKFTAIGTNFKSSFRIENASTPMLTTTNMWAHFRLMNRAKYSFVYIFIITKMCEEINGLEIKNHSSGWSICGMVSLLFRFGSICEWNGKKNYENENDLKHETWNVCKIQF